MYVMTKLYAGGLGNGKSLHFPCEPKAQEAQQHPLGRAPELGQYQMV
jgi:hypothetical protein